MTLVTSPFIRSICERVLDTLPAKKPEYVMQQINSSFFDELSEVVLHRQASVAEQVSREHQDLISLSYVGALAVASFAVLFDQPGLPRIVPLSWKEAGIPDPELTIHALLSSICGHSLAVLSLIRSGFEAPARILLRNVHELSWITIAVSADIEMMRVYAQDLPDEEERRLFWTYFSPRALNTRLERLETDLGLEDDVTSALAASRRNTYAFYSKTVHNSYASIILGLVGFSMERTGYAALGMATEASTSTLSSLTDGLFYVLGFFFEVIRQLHTFSPPYPIEWQEAIAAREAFIAAHYLYRRKHPDN